MLSEKVASDKTGLLKWVRFSNFPRKEPDAHHYPEGANAEAKVHQWSPGAGAGQELGAAA